MKITNKSANIETEFRNIKVGEAFYYPWTDVIYMKTEAFHEENGIVIANVVNLRSGNLCVFSEDVKVNTIECECIIN